MNMRSKILLINFLYYHKISKLNKFMKFIKIKYLYKIQISRLVQQHFINILINIFHIFAKLNHIKIIVTIVLWKSDQQEGQNLKMKKKNIKNIQNNIKKLQNNLENIIIQREQLNLNYQILKNLQLYHLILLKTYSCQNINNNLQNCTFYRSSGQQYLE